MRVRKLFLLFIALVGLETYSFCETIQKINPEYSTAGFYELPNSGREVYNFNTGWRFVKKDVKDAELADFDDSAWSVVNTPHGLELLPAEASGSINYQGVAWYRKHFQVEKSMKNKKIFLHFEAVMGKCKIWVNGKLVKQHFGGYIPFIVDVSEAVSFDKMNVVAVKADNSDDVAYPPGKTQKQLDFVYFGGIYRDVWLISTNKVHVTDPNHVDKIAGGGVFVHYDNISEKAANILVNTDIVNEGSSRANLSLITELKNKEGKVVGRSVSKLKLASSASNNVKQSISIKTPNLWTPDTPYLYDLFTTIKNAKGKVVDGFKKRIGIRKIEFRGKEGFYLNGKPYHDKLIGANRHQDFGYIGNALPNSLQWRDVKKLRDVGMRIIRSAHYPQDPAFMDACDELGMFIIVATPGWQFWNKDPQFEKLVYSDIKNMVRRDRNNPSVILWEPILNETWYPDYFAKNVHDLVHEEYPYQGVYTACDDHAKGQKHFDVIYSHPRKNKKYSAEEKNSADMIRIMEDRYKGEDRSMFTREWGDNVDDWSSHNSPSRAAKVWGERPQLVQSNHYANPDYAFSCYESIYTTPKQHVGGTLWHSFDHQRGYHPDTFYGGITDCFRQPKYSYFLFASQRDPKIDLEKADSGPMIFVANEMTPFSESDVTVFTNCDEVRLIVYEKDTLYYKVEKYAVGMKHPPVVFKNVFNFMDLKRMHRSKKAAKASFIAEGLIDGKVVATFKRMPAKRASHIKLSVDDENMKFVADGSDIVVVIAKITDQDGIVKRLNNCTIKFDIEGEGVILSEPGLGINPCKVEWGEARILVRTTNKAGKIVVKANLIKSGINMATSDEIEFESTALNQKTIYSEVASDDVSENYVLESSMNKTDLQQKLDKVLKELNDYKLKEVGKQQEQFEGKK